MLFTNVPFFNCYSILDLLFEERLEGDTVYARVADLRYPKFGEPLTKGRDAGHDASREVGKEMA